MRLGGVVVVEAAFGRGNNGRAGGGWGSGVLWEAGGRENSAKGERAKSEAPEAVGHDRQI